MNSGEKHLISSHRQMDRRTWTHILVKPGLPCLKRKCHHLSRYRFEDFTMSASTKPLFSEVHQQVLGGEGRKPGVLSHSFTGSTFWTRINMEASRDGAVVLMMPSIFSWCRHLILNSGLCSCSPEIQPNGVLLFPSVNIQRPHCHSLSAIYRWKLFLCLCIICVNG